MTNNFIFSFLIIIILSNFFFKMKVVILAAGRGKRMGKWTENTTKTMLKLNDKPLLTITIENCKAYGLNDFILVVGYRKDDIIETFKDGKEMGINVRYSIQQNICGGTADALNCVDFFFPDKDESFILIYGDVVPTAADIGGLLKCAQINKDKDCAIMGVRKVEDPTRYGVVETNDDNVINIVEKSKNPPSNIINAGIYILPVKMFDHAKNTPLSERGEYELTDSLMMYLRNGGCIKWHILTGLKDIGTKQIYEKIKVEQIHL